MNRSQLANERRKAARASQDKLDRQIERAQSALYFAFLDIFSDLRKSDGRVVLSNYNLGLLRKIAPLIKRWVRNETRDFARIIIKSTAELLNLNRKYFNEVTDVRDAIVNRVETRTYLGIGYDQKKKQLIQDGFIDGIVKNTGVGQRIGTLTRSAVLGQIEAKVFKEGIDRFVRGGDKSGQLEKELKPQTDAIYSGIDRGTQAGYANDLALMFFYYQGTIKNNTRDFCAQRAGNLYDTNELEKWNDLDWAGKIEGADIRVVAGGYNCRHHLSFISNELAELVQKRGAELNKYNGIVLG